MAGRFESVMPRLSSPAVRGLTNRRLAKNDRRKPERMITTMMNDKLYKILKYIAMIFLPALGTLYFALAGIWGFPYAEQVVGTITAVDTFLGVILGISTAQYNKKLGG